MKLFYLPTEKPKNPYGKRETKREFSTEELVHYLEDHDIHSSRQLKATRQKGEPTVYDYQKHFGSWNEALNYTYGEDPIEALFTIPHCHDYFVKTVCLYGLWRYDDYCNARAKEPGIVPSLRQVRKLFGSYSALKDAAKCYSLSATLNQVLDLGRVLGRTPKLSDCKKAEINVGSLIIYYKSFKAAKKFIKRLLRVSAKGQEV